MLFGTLLVTPTPTFTNLETTPNNQQNDLVKELVKGLFSEQMSNTVKESPSDRYLIYAFLIIAVVLIVSLIAIIKIASSSANRAITDSVKPYIEQLGNFQKSFERSQDTYEIMSNKFSNLTEEIIKFQSLRSGEEDMFTVMFRQFESLQNRITDNIGNLFVALREHEKNSYERQLAMQRYNYEVRMALLEIKAYAGVPYAKNFGQRLIDKGFINKEELEEILAEIIKD